MKIVQGYCEELVLGAAYEPTDVGWILMDSQQLNLAVKTRFLDSDEEVIVNIPASTITEFQFVPGEDYRLFDN